MPRCDCGAPLKPDVVLFGEYLPVDALARAERLAAGADLMLCIGSSLEVYPVARLPETTLAAGGQIAILTQGPTPFDRRAAVRMGGDVVDELEAVLARRSRPSPSGRSARASARALSAASIRPSANSIASRWAVVERARRARPARPRATGVAQAAQLLEAIGQRRRGGSPASSASAASSATSTCSAASRVRPSSRSSRARSASSSEASGRWRPVSSAASRACGAEDPSSGAGDAAPSISSRASVHSPSATSSPAP